MSGEPPAAAGNVAAPATRPKRGPQRLILGLALTTALAVAILWLLNSRRGPPPPHVALEGVDPAVAEAVRQARQHVLERPRASDVWGELGMVLRAHDFGEEANRCFAEAERLNPDEPRWPYLHALTLLLTAPEQALPLLQRAVKRSGKLIEPRLRLAEALLASGRLDEAEEQFCQALALQPDHPRAHLGLGRLAYQRERFEEEVTHLRRAVGSPYSRKAASTLLLEIAHRLNDVQSIKGLGAVSDLPEDLPWRDPFVEEVERLQVGRRATIARASSLFRERRYPEAMALFRQVVSDYPDSDQAWLAFGQVLVQMKDYAAAEQALRKATTLAPPSVEGHFQLGVALYLQNKREQAADCFRKSIHLKPSHALAHFNLGHCLKEEGDVPGALKEFRAALRYRPGYLPAQRQIEQLGAK